MKGGVVVRETGVNYDPERFNFILSLLTPSTNNTQHPNVYMIPIVTGLFDMTTIDEILQPPNYLIISIEYEGFLFRGSNRFEIIYSLHNPPQRSRTTGRMIIGSSSFVISEHVFFVQHEGNYKIFDLSRYHRTYPAEYQEKLTELGLGDEQRLFPIIQPGQE